MVHLKDPSVNVLALLDDERIDGESRMPLANDFVELLLLFQVKYFRYGFKERRLNRALS